MNQEQGQMVTAPQVEIPQIPSEGKDSTSSDRPPSAAAPLLRVQASEQTATAVPRLGSIGGATYTIDANGNASVIPTQQGNPAPRPTQREEVSFLRNPWGPPQWVQQGMDFISEAEAKQSPWFTKNMGLLRDTLKEQLEKRGLDKNGSKEALAIRLARYQMQEERTSVPTGQDRRARSSSASYERSS